MDINPKKFQESINKEFGVIQNRVRNLIGEHHWGEDGRYKEAVLRTILRKFLPANMSLGTGFILKKEDDRIEISTQIDIVVYDNTYPVLFSEGDFVITTPENVKAIIEVKTGLTSANVEEVISKASVNGKLVNSDIFNGIFVYNSGSLVNEGIHENLEKALKASKGLVNHISLGEGLFIKFWSANDRNSSRDLYSLYKIKSLSFSYFISNLLEKISKNRLIERWWFLYPIEKGKEEYKILDIQV